MESGAQGIGMLLNSIRQAVMRFRNSARICLAAALFLPLIPLATAAQQAPALPSLEHRLLNRIDTSVFGYREPGRMERLTEGETSVALSFLDETHVLLTFDSKKLVQRLPSCPPEHADRIVHAVVLDIASGAKVKEADWYLHDRRQYLWRFGPGKVLLRKLNDLYVVDANLHERLLFHSSKDLVWVNVTPDASQIIIETAADPVPTHEEANVSAIQPPRFVAQFLDSATLLPQRTVPLKEIVNLKGSKWGYDDQVQYGDVWLVRFGPTTMQRRNLTRVRSRTVPSIFYSSDNSLLIGRCASASCQYTVSSYSLAGQLLWRQHWPQYRWFPTITHTEDSSRFSVSALGIAPTTPAGVSGENPDPFQPQISDLDVFQQQVQVFNTATGETVFSIGVQPAMMSGENVALSPDGLAVAVLEGTSLEVFGLPPLTKDQQAEFAQLEASNPSTYALANVSDPDGSPTASTGTTRAPSDPSHDQPTSKAIETAVTDPAPSTMAARSTGVTETSAPSNSGAEGRLATIKVTTKTVLVDVVVTDRKGQPVHGLHQQDFQVAEDGKPQDIRSFQEFYLQPESAPAKAAEPKTPASVFGNTSQPESGAVTLILFDLLNTPLQDQVFARDQLAKFLQSKPSNLQIALCTLSSGRSHLHLVQGFTTDNNTLLAAARGKKISPNMAAWQRSASSTRNDVQEVGELANGSRSNGFQNLLSALQETQAEEQSIDTDQRVGVTLDSLMTLSRYLAGIPGRKNVVWLSGSFPISLPSPYDFGDPKLSNQNYSPAVKAVTNLLAEAQVAVYPVDVKGLRGGGLSAEMDPQTNIPTDAGPQGVGGTDAQSSITAPRASISPEQQREFNEAGERVTLMAVAAATGGKAFYNTNGISKAIATSIEQGSNYYSISYNPTNKDYDGRFRKIKVALAEKGYTLRYRQGYFATNNDHTGDAARRARTEAMRHGSPESRQLLFTASVVPVGPKEKVDGASIGEILLASNKAPKLPPTVEAQHYTIDYSFKTSDLTFVPEENGDHRNTLILMMSSFDREGTTLSANSSMAISELHPPDYAQVVNGAVSLHQEIDVPVAAASLRLGIQDQMSSHIGTIELPLPPPNVQRAPRENLPPIEPD